MKLLPQITDQLQCYAQTLNYPAHVADDFFMPIKEEEVKSKAYADYAMNESHGVHALKLDMYILVSPRVPDIQYTSNV